MIQQPTFDNATSAQFFAGFVGLLKWASSYGHELLSSAHVVESGISKEKYPAFLELSVPLSASLNFGYDPDDQSIFMVVEMDEFEWLQRLPIEEVVVGRENVYILTYPITLADEVLEPIAIAVKSGQKKLWRAFPGATTIGFMCIHHSDESYDVNEYSGNRFTLRYLND